MISRQDSPQSLHNGKGQLLAPVWPQTLASDCWSAAGHQHFPVLPSRPPQATRPTTPMVTIPGTGPSSWMPPGLLHLRRGEVVRQDAGLQLHFYFLAAGGAPLAFSKPGCMQQPSLWETPETLPSINLCVQPPLGIASPASPPKTTKRYAVIT